MLQWSHVNDNIIPLELLSVVSLWAHSCFLQSPPMLALCPWVLTVYHHKRIAPHFHRHCTAVQTVCALSGDVCVCVHVHTCVSKIRRGAKKYTHKHTDAHTHMHTHTNTHSDTPYPVGHSSMPTLFGYQPTLTTKSQPLYPLNGEHLHQLLLNNQQ